MQKTNRHALEDLILTLQDIKDAELVCKLEIAGSYRRGKTYLKDLDVAIYTTNRTQLRKKLIELLKPEFAGRGLARMDFKGVPYRGRITSGKIDIQFFVTENPDEWGALLLAATGDKEFNIMLRSAAKKKGWQLNEKTLTDQKGQWLAGLSEYGVLWCILGPEKSKDYLKASSRSLSPEKEELPPLPPIPDHRQQTVNKLNAAASWYKKCKMPFKSAAFRDAALIAKNHPQSKWKELLTKKMFDLANYCVVHRDLPQERWDDIKKACQEAGTLWESSP